MKIGISSCSGLPCCWFFLLISIISTITITTKAQDGCIDDLQKILLQEDSADITKVRIYILCPDTTFYPGAINADSTGFIDDQFPIIVRSKAQVQCGEDGSSKNNCIIDGSGAFGILIDSSFFPQDTVGTLNIKIKGITFSEFTITTEPQNMVTFRTFLGRLELFDCVFEFSGASNMFEFTQILQPERRQLTASMNYDSDENQNDVIDFNTTDITTNLNDRVKNYLTTYKHLSESLRQRNSITSYDNKNDVNRDLSSSSSSSNISRKLQRGRKYNVFIKQCIFRDITLPLKAGTQRSLSLLHFSAVDPDNFLADSLEDTTMNVQILSTTFDNIKTSYESDPDTTHRSVIDFYSGGKLTMRDVCFRNIEQSTNGASALVLSQKTSITSNVQGTSILTQDVIYGPGEATCPLISLVENNMGNAYMLTGCSPIEATAVTCFDEPPPPATAPPPGGGGGFFACFSSKNSVQVLITNDDHNTVHRLRMDQLKLGDRVLVDNNKNEEKYEPIYSFGHHHKTQTATFIQLMPSRIELSSQHLIFLQDGRAVPAGIVRVGDVLQSGQIVTAIRTVTRHTGMYAPFTPSGKIVVNDQMASSFVSLQPQSDVLVLFGRWSTGITHQWLAYTFELPHRLWCSYSSNKGCTKETYTTDGISTWVAVPLQFFLWLLDDDNNKPNNKSLTQWMIGTATFLIMMIGRKAMCNNPTTKKEI